MDPISIMLVDDHYTFLDMTAVFLQAQEGLRVVGKASNGIQALDQAQALRPDIILVDMAMPHMPGLEVIERLRHMLPEIKIIALTVMNSPNFRQAALNAGADAFVPKSRLRADLLPAIWQLARASQEQDSETKTLSSCPAMNARFAPSEI